MKMSPEEFWTLYYAKVERTQKKVGGLTDEDKDRLIELLKNSQEE